MNKLPQSIYTSEFKAQAVEQAKAQGTSVAARALGLRPQTLAIELEPMQRVNP